MLHMDSKPHKGAFMGLIVVDRIKSIGILFAKKNMGSLSHSIASRLKKCAKLQ